MRGRESVTSLGVDLGELTDDAIAGDWRIWQRRRGHRYSLDDVATAATAVRTRPAAESYLDLGCGLGSVLLMVSYKLSATALPTPPDPVGVGDCSLLLALTDEASGAPVASRVLLYRLNAPGNEHWTAGDQLQAMLDVPKEGLWVHGLPQGSYRIHALAQRRGSDDAFRFGVRAETTEKRIAVPMPRRFASFLVIVNERGQPIPTAKLRVGGRFHMYGKPVVPWLRSRKLREPERYATVLGFGAGCGSYGRCGQRALTAGPRGFVLGEFFEDSRSRETSQSLTARLERRTRVRVRRSHSVARDQTWIALSLDPQPIRESVFFPDGSPVPAKRVEIRGDAVLAPDPCPPDFWRRLEVTVRVQMAGYQTLEFGVRPGEHLEPRYLEFAAPSGAE